MSPQLTLNFSKVTPADEDGKKLKRIGIACSDEFKELFDMVCKLRGATPSELGFEYVLRGMKDDLVNVFMPQPHMDKSLKEAIRRFA